MIISIVVVSNAAIVAAELVVEKLLKYPWWCELEEESESVSPNGMEEEPPPPPWVNEEDRLNKYIAGNDSTPNGTTWEKMTERRAILLQNIAKSEQNTFESKSYWWKDEYKKLMDQWME